MKTIREKLFTHRPGQASNASASRDPYALQVKNGKDGAPALLHMTIGGYGSRLSPGRQQDVQPC